MAASFNFGVLIKRIFDFIKIVLLDIKKNTPQYFIDNQSFITYFNTNMTNHIGPTPNLKSGRCPAYKHLSSDNRTFCQIRSSKMR